MLLHDLLAALVSGRESALPLERFNALVADTGAHVRIVRAPGGWLYVDRSQNGLRRWREMSTCGTAEKNRRRAHR